MPKKDNTPSKSESDTTTTDVDLSFESKRDWSVHLTGTGKFMTADDFRSIPDEFLKTIEFDDNYTFDERELARTVIDKLGHEFAIALAVKLAIGGYQAKNASDMKAEIRVGPVSKTVDGLLSEIRIARGRDGDGKGLDNKDVTVGRICRVFAHATHKYLLVKKSLSSKLLSKDYARGCSVYTEAQAIKEEKDRPTWYTRNKGLLMAKPDGLRPHLFIGGENVCSMEGDQTSQAIRDAFRICAVYKDAKEGSGTKWIDTMNALFMARGEIKYRGS